MLGGYGKFGLGTQVSKTFTNIKPHFKLVISLKLWHIDSWDGDEAFKIYVEGVLQYNKVKSTGYSGGSF